MASKAVAKKTGRKPALLEPVKREELLNLIVLGVPISKSVGMVGISEATFYNWMSRGLIEKERLNTIANAKPRPEEKIYLEFLESVTRARAEAVAKKVAVISSAAGQGDWKASAWWLERQVPEEFGKIERQEILSQSYSEVKVTVSMGELQDKIAKVLEARKK